LAGEALWCKKVSRARFIFDEHDTRFCGFRHEIGYRSQELTPMTERDTDVLKVLIREIGQDGKADIVLGKALRVLPKTELLKPIGDLLHRGSAPDYRASSARIGKFIRQTRSAVGEQPMPAAISGGTRLEHPSRSVTPLDL
jgi:hypothetical protein